MAVYLDRVCPLFDRAIGSQGLTKVDAEYMFCFQIRMTMPKMGDNFTVENNRHEPVLSITPNNSGALVMDQISRQIIEMCMRAYAFEGR